MTPDERKKLEELEPLLFFKVLTDEELVIVQKAAEKYLTIEKSGLVEAAKKRVKAKPSGWCTSIREDMCPCGHNDLKKALSAIEEK